MTLTVNRNRIINGSNHVIVVEEVTSMLVLHEMFVQISSLIAGADSIVEELEEAMPKWSGLEFVVMHYYDDFVSPSNFQGYALAVLSSVPSLTNEIIRDIVQNASDDALARIFLIATRNDEKGDKFDVLLKHSEDVVQRRIHTLRNL